MADEIKAGDVVQLNSGGPKMTVEEVGVYGGIKKARCSWFEEQKNHSNIFPLAALKRLD